MNADNSAGTRDLLASNRTLLAWVRTAVAFAGLGFVVAKFGRTTSTIHEAGYLGIFLVLVGLALIVIGYIQHRSVVMSVKPPNRAPEVSLAWLARRLAEEYQAAGALPRARSMAWSKLSVLP